MDEKGLFKLGFSHTQFMNKVCVVGLGYVGLPTALAFAGAGLKTVGVDVRSDVVDKVNQGVGHLDEPGIAEAVSRSVKSGMLRATTDIEGAIADSESVIVSVQTPYENGQANLSYVKEACGQVGRSLRRGSLLVVESTVPPGTCRNVLLPTVESGGRREGVDFFFAYCPERIAPGNSLSEFKSNDRILGADSPESMRRARELMALTVSGRLVETGILNAETSKLVENTARDVYIAFANDLAKICSRLGVDVREVIRLANTHPRVKILDPGPGVGGPCLPKDPFLLLSSLGGEPRSNGDMIRTARKVNDSMPGEVFGLVRGIGTLRPGDKVAVLGTSYKPGVGDPRASPSEKVVRLLLGAGYDVHSFDPYCREGFGAKVDASLESAIDGAKCAVFLVAHSAFRSVELRKMADALAEKGAVVDAVGLFTGSPPGQREVMLIRLGDGRRPVGRPSARPRGGEGRPQRGN